LLQANNDINLLAYSGNYTNSGLILSTLGTVRFWVPVLTNSVNINGVGGTIQAFNGAINVRDPIYHSTGGIMINGGEYDSLLGFNLFSGSGSITGNFSAPLFSTTTTGAVSLVDNTTSGIRVLASTGGSFSLNTAGPVMLTSLTTSNGSIFVDAATGLLETAAASDVRANNGSVTLENDDMTAGTIQLDFGSEISTTGTGGPVNVVIGPVPASPAPGSAPAANVVVNNISGGMAFFGTNGITANPPDNTLNLAGSNIVFNTGSSAATAITLNGGVTVTADPSTATAPIHIGSATIVTSAATANAGDNLINQPALLVDANNTVLVSPAIQAASSVVPTDLLSKHGHNAGTDSSNDIVPIAFATCSTPSTDGAATNTGSSGGDCVVDSGVDADD
jgi:hypothetical protein